jgi:hypothetical protein
LGGPLKDTSWWQATAGVTYGGLGFREAAAVALPAALASRITVRPLALHMATHAADAGLLTLQQFTRSYDARTRAAFEKLRNLLPTEVHDDLKQLAEEGAAAAAARWEQLQQGEQSRTSGGAGRRPGQYLVLDAGEEDAERPDDAGRTGPGLQALFTQLVDQCLHEALRVEHTAAEAWPDVNRLKELADPGCNHDWLWSLSPNHGPTLTSQEFVDAVRVRLGGGGCDEPVPCRLCNKVLDPSGSHALCCALAEATRGHNAVRDQLHKGARGADPTAELEPLGLIPGHPTLRPADVFTSAAVPGRLSALDVGICSPDAGAAGDDCTESMRLRKLSDYGSHLGALERQNIEYRPMVWSAYGRPHSAATQALRAICRCTARRRGLVKADALYRRTHAAITVEIWRRAARMVAACWPHPTTED